MASLGIRRPGMLLSIGLGLALATPHLAAHGGAYRGPLGPGGGIGGGPGTGGRPTAPTPGPTSNPVPIASNDPTSWQFWWEHNKDSYLRLRETVLGAGPVSGSDEFFMGARQSHEPESLAPTDFEKQEIVLPALHRALQSTSNRDVVTACMVAMAKIGMDASGIDPLAVFRRELKRGDQEVRETAALCLGIIRRADAMPDLLALVLDDHAGRRLLDARRVDERTRAFAAYGLGLLAGGQGDTAMKSRVAATLGSLLEVDDRDLRVAAINALSLIAPDDSTAAGKRLLWSVLETLLDFYRRDLGKGDQIVQAHVPPAIARLLGRGTTVEHERYKRLFAEELAGDGKDRPRDVIPQSAAIALGKMCLPRERHAGDAGYGDLLLEVAREGKDELTRYLSLMALGEIGGEWARASLLDYYAGANRATALPWAAIALGVQAFHAQAAGGDVDHTLGAVLTRDYRTFRDPYVRGALAVAIGLCHYRPAIPVMIDAMREYDRQDVLVGYACVGLAMIPAPMAVDDIREVVEAARRRPQVMTLAAIALGKLGDQRAIELLATLMDDHTPSLASLAGVASAFRFIGDRRAIAPLIALLDGDDLTKTSRAFVAAALGGIADKDLLPWNHAIAEGCNYAAIVATLVNGSNGVLDIL